MSSKKYEKDLESDCVFMAEVAGFLAYKLDKARRADPDQLFVRPDRSCFFVEFKLPGEKPRPQQRKRLNELVEAGQEVYVITNRQNFALVLRGDASELLYPHLA